MPAISFPAVNANMSTEELANLVAKLMKEVEWLCNGNMDSYNIRNIAGYRVDRNFLQHQSGIVGMNGADPTNPEAVRFWAGAADPDTAPFRVNQAGKMTATGAVIESSSGSYPRIYLDAETGVFGVEQSEGYGVYIVPNYLGTTPAVFFNQAGVTRAIISLTSDGVSFGMSTTGSTNASMQGANDATITANSNINLNSGDIKVNGATAFSGTFQDLGGETVTVRNGLIIDVS